MCWIAGADPGLGSPGRGPARTGPGGAVGRRPSPVGRGDPDLIDPELGRPYRDGCDGPPTPSRPPASAPRPRPPGGAARSARNSAVRRGSIGWSKTSGETRSSRGASSGPSRRMVGLIAIVSSPGPTRLSLAHPGGGADGSMFRIAAIRQPSGFPLQGDRRPHLAALAARGLLRVRPSASATSGASIRTDSTVMLRLAGFPSTIRACLGRAVPALPPVPSETSWSASAVKSDSMAFTSLASRASTYFWTTARTAVSPADAAAGSWAVSGA